MKTITFYNEKGGVGKSTLTCMYASWLRYVHGVRVTVADFDDRLEAYREEEARQWLAKGRKLPQEKPWKLLTCRNSTVEDIRREGKTSTPHALWLVRMINMEKEAGTEVLILDFPGATNGMEFTETVMTRLLSLCCVVFDRDEQTMEATFRLIQYLNGKKDLRKAGIQAGVQPYYSRSLYEDIAREVARAGLPVLPDLISCSEKIKDMNKDNIIRSTLTYPDWNEKDFGKAGDLGYGNLFLDVTRELRECPDIVTTERASLDFIVGLEKEPQPRRQMHGTAFPQYEMPENI